MTRREESGVVGAPSPDSSVLSLESGLLQNDNSHIVSNSKAQSSRIDIDQVNIIINHLHTGIYIQVR